jgi:hypothetical protein
MLLREAQIVYSAPVQATCGNRIGAASDTSPGTLFLVVLR